MPLPTNISDATRRLNPQIFGVSISSTSVEKAKTDMPTKLVAGIVMPDTAKKRLRQHQGDGLNKTERAYLAELKFMYPNAEIFPQALSFRIGNGANFRPDFIVRRHFAGSGLYLEAHETKGFKREAAAVRIKVAASMYPWIKFFLVTKRKGSGWDIEPVLG